MDEEWIRVSFLVTLDERGKRQWKGIAYASMIRSGDEQNTISKSVARSQRGREVHDHDSVQFSSVSILFFGLWN